jgi:hypothetical protein
MTLFILAFGRLPPKSYPSSEIQSISMSICLLLCKYKYIFMRFVRIIPTNASFIIFLSFRGLYNTLVSHKLIDMCIKISYK